MAYGCANGIPKGLIVTSETGFAETSLGPNKRAITKQALRINRGAADGLAHNFVFRVSNPSDRLHLAITVAFESDSGTEYTITNVTWQLVAMLRNAATSRSTPGQLIYGPVAAPDGYEVDSGVQEIRGTVFVPTTSAFGFAVGDGGWFVTQATWEENSPVDTKEAARLLGLASLTIDGTPVATTFL
jgi:hypothetical protein